MGTPRGESGPELDRLTELATASAFPEAATQVNASFRVDSAEGLRATFEGQGTLEGDEIVRQHELAALEALREIQSADEEIF